MYLNTHQVSVNLSRNIGPSDIFKNCSAYFNSVDYIENLIYWLRRKRKHSNYVLLTLQEKNNIGDILHVLQDNCSGTVIHFVVRLRLLSLGQLVVYRSAAQRWWGLGQRVPPNWNSRLGCSPSDIDKENLWRREVKKRNNSILASCSPRHTRFPEDAQ